MDYSEILVKAKALPEGTVRSRRDGHRYKKVGSRWIRIASTKTLVDQEKETINTAENYFNQSMASNLGWAVENVLDVRGINGFKGLIAAIKKGPVDTAHSIYKQIVDDIREANGTVGDKKAVVDFIGRSLLYLKNQYASKPVPRLSVTRTSKTGKEYREKKSYLPVIKASVASRELKKIGGWSVTGPLTTGAVKSMLSTGSAKMLSGKLSAKKKWILPQKAEDMSFSFRGNGLTIIAKQVNMREKRTRATAKVSITIPYAFLHSFLHTHIKSARTRNNFARRIELSPGYIDYMDSARAS